MNPLLIAKFLGWLLIGLSAMQLLPTIAAAIFGEPVLPYAASAMIALACGLPIVIGVRVEDTQMRIRDGYLVVIAAWVLASAFGSLPYDLTDTLEPVDSLFESVSGFTTTGSTVMSHIAGVPRALLLWRSMTQWIGGMGIILFAVALMPLLGIGGMHLFRAEVPGPVADKLTPRIAETARRLWFIYVGLTALEWIALVVAGMTPYEALCHALTTLSTGGFSTNDKSIGGFNSPLVEWIVIVFMLLASINFVIHYRLMVGQIRSALGDAELRYYLLLLAGATAVVVWALSHANQTASVRIALFQVISIATTTGYATADFETWPALALLVILQLMFLGGMAGSTSGGVKSLRALIGLRAMASVFNRFGHRSAVRHPVRYGGKAVPDRVLAAIWAFFALYIIIVTAVALIVAAAGYDIVTALTAALTAVGNVGPGLGQIGPYDNFAVFPPLVKLTLCGAMIAGRLELFTVLVIFRSDFWKR
ncbi:MAG: TrkH family potassium uptake protein [Deltaproteobacteria bacterium]|jgi:trk system potassium uptake protein TrkH|nr:TrkH family potassium uptake protein [Deltaproteobacteria bacterium]